MTEQVAEPEGDAPGEPARGPNRWRRLRAPKIAAVVLLVGVTAWRIWLSVQWSWFQDDWVYVRDAARMSFWPYIAQNYNGHLMPGQFALVWTITRIAPLQYALATVVLVALATASLIVWWRLLVRLLGPGWRSVVPLVPLSLSAAFVPTNLWFAAGLQAFSLQLCLGLVLWASVRWLGVGQRRHLVLALAAFVGGLLMWEKAVLAVVPVAGLTLFLVRRWSSPPTRPRIVALAVALVAAAGAYSVVYLTSATSGSDAVKILQPRGWTEVVGFYWTGLTELLLPAVLGGPWDPQASIQTGVVPPGTALRWVILGAVALIVVWSLSWRPAAWTLWATAAVYCLVSWGLLLTSSRFDTLGSFGILDPRYAADSIPVVLLFAAMALAPVVGERRWPPGSRLLWRGRPWLAPAAAAALVGTCLLASGSLWDTVRPGSPKTWNDNLLGAASSVAGVTLFDSRPPANVMVAGLFPDDSLVSQMLEPISPRWRFDKPTTRLLAVGAQGDLRVASIGDAAVSQPGPLQGCGYVVKPGESAFVPMNRGLFAWNWGMTVRYVTVPGSTAGSLRVATDAETTTLPLQDGPGTVQAVVVDSVSALRLTTVGSSAPVCVDVVSIGLVSPSDQRP